MHDKCMCKMCRPLFAVDVCECFVLLKNACTNALLQLEAHQPLSIQTLGCWIAYGFTLLFTQAYLQSRECWAIQFVYIVFFLGWLHYFLVCTSYFVVVVSFLQMFYVRQEKSKKTLRPVFPIKAHSPLMNVLHSHLMQETDIFFCVILAAVALFVVTIATTIYLDLKV